MLCYVLPSIHFLLLITFRAHVHCHVVYSFLFHKELDLRFPLFTLTGLFFQPNDELVFMH